MSTVNTKLNIEESKVTIKGKAISLREFMDLMNLNRVYNNSHREYGMEELDLLKLLNPEQLEVVLSTDEIRSDLCDRHWETLRYLYNNSFDV